MGNQIHLALSTDNNMLIEGHSVKLWFRSSPLSIFSISLPKQGLLELTRNVDLFFVPICRTIRNTVIEHSLASSFTEPCTFHVTEY